MKSTLTIILVLIIVVVFSFTSITFYQIANELEDKYHYKGTTIVEDIVACYLSEKFLGKVSSCNTEEGTSITYNFNSKEKFYYLDYKSDNRVVPFVYTVSGATAFMGLLMIIVILKESKEWRG